MDNIGTIILATGALGTAAFGIVESLKWTPLGGFGFGSIHKVLGPIMDTLKVAYGPDFEKLLRAQYRGDQRELARVIRQGVRIGLTEDNAGYLAEFLGMVDANKLQQATMAAQLPQQDDDSTTFPPELRNELGKFELAVDARIDAALTLAQNHYVGATRVAASIFAVAIALFVGFYLGNEYIFQSVLVGIAAVPLAPVAKDLVTALQFASKAIRTKP